MYFKSLRKNYMDSLANDDPEIESVEEVHVEPAAIELLGDTDKDLDYVRMTREWLIWYLVDLARYPSIDGIA